MKNENCIGKKVYVLNENEYSTRLESKDVYTIVGFKPFDEVDDYCAHIIVKGKDNSVKEVKEYCCIFIPDEKLGEVDMVDRFLSDNDCYHDEVYHHSKLLAIHISWGDWKHEHMWCEKLMEYLGYKPLQEIVTEENGSDCYSAIHYFFQKP